MKTTYTIAAIAMFAVIMGMSAIAPAMAGKPAQADKIWVCHFAEAEQEIDPLTGLPAVDENKIPVITPAHYVVIHISENGWNGHQNHLDGNEDVDYRDFETNDEVLVSAECVVRNDALDQAP